MRLTNIFLALLFTVLGASAATFPVAMSTTNGFSFGRLTVNDHIHATNVLRTNTFAGPIQQGGKAYGTASAAFGLNTEASSLSFATGRGNRSLGSGSLASGTTNTIFSGGQNSLVGGSSNTVGSPNNFAVGSFNAVNGNNSAAIGSSMSFDSESHNTIGIGSGIFFQGTPSNTIAISAGLGGTTVTRSNSFIVNAPSGSFFSGGPITGDGSGLTNLSGGAAFPAAVTNNDTRALVLTNADTFKATNVWDKSNVKFWGAVGDAATDDTAAFTSALAAKKYVVVPEGNYVVTGFSIPANTTLELLPGAALRTSGSIILDTENSQFIGYHVDVTSNPTVTNFNVLWTGAASGVAVDVGSGVVTSPIGVRVAGIAVYGADVSGVIGFRFGNGGQGPAWSHFRDLFAAHVSIGFHVVASAQQCYFDNMSVREASYKGIYIEGRTNLGAITTLFFSNTHVEGTGATQPPICIDIGGTNGAGGSFVNFNGGVLEVSTNGVGFNLASGGPYKIGNFYTEGGLNGIVIGRASSYANAEISSCFIQGCTNAIEGIGWRSLKIHDNLTGSYSNVFLNTGGGLFRFGGRAWNNTVDFGAPTEFSGGTTGFDIYMTENNNGSSVPSPVLTLPSISVTSTSLFASTLTSANSKFIYDGANSLTVPATMTTPASTALAISPTLGLNITAGGGGDINLNGSANFAFQSQQQQVVTFKGTNAATAGSISKDSLVLSLVGAYWNGSASTASKMYIYEDVEGNNVASLVLGSGDSNANPMMTLRNNAGVLGVGIGTSIPAARLDVSGTVRIGTSGTNITNVRHGISGAMVLGTVTVTDAGCTSNTRYFFSAHTLGTISIPGGYYASTRNAGTSFVITSSQATETSTIDWMAVEP